MHGWTWCALVLALAACESKSAPPAPASRTDGAKVAATQGPSTDAFCDFHVADDRGAAFAWPQLAAGGAAPSAPTTWRWINVWATWCKPCIAEMPRLAAWRDKLAAAGKKIELVFLSVDESDEEIAAYRKDHPDTPVSLRVSSVAERTAWLKRLQIDDGAIPIQLFVSPADRLRCARAGGVRERDYDAVAKLLGE